MNRIRTIGALAFALLAVAATPAAAQTAAKLNAIVPKTAPASGLQVSLSVRGTKEIKAGPDKIGVAPLDVLLQLEAKVSQPSKVYIFDWGTDGMFRLLLPNKQDAATVLPAGGTVVLPGPKAAYSFKVTPPLGLDTMKVVAVEGDHSAMDRFVEENFDTKQDFSPSKVPAVAAIDKLSTFLHGSKLSWAANGLQLRIVQK